MLEQHGEIRGDIFVFGFEHAAPCDRRRSRRRDRSPRRSGGLRRRAAASSPVSSTPARTWARAWSPSAPRAARGRRAPPRVARSRRATDAPPCAGMAAINASFACSAPLKSPSARSATPTWSKEMSCVSTPLSSRSAAINAFDLGGRVASLHGVETPGGMHRAIRRELYSDLSCAGPRASTPSRAACAPGIPPVAGCGSSTP